MLSARPAPGRPPRSGGEDGVSAAARRLLAASGLFDEAFYRRSYPEAAEDRFGPLHDYLRRGWRRGRRPNPFFDPTFYLARNPDVRASGQEPLGHFIRFGADELRAASANFDTRYYCSRNPDVAASGLNPLLHFLRHGLARGRLAVEPGGPAADPTGGTGPGFSRYRLLNGLGIVDPFTDPWPAALVAALRQRFQLPVVALVDGGPDSGSASPATADTLRTSDVLEDCDGDAGRAWDDIADCLARRGIGKVICASPAAAAAVPPLKRRGFDVVALLRCAERQEDEPPLDRGLDLAYHADCILAADRGAAERFVGRFGAPAGRLTTWDALPEAAAPAADLRFTDDALRDLASLLQFGRTVGERRAERDRDLGADVSVVVPAYRAEAHIEERMASIFEQTVLPREIVVLDDASPDGTWEALQRLALLAPVPIRLMRNGENSGSPFRQWQRGLEAAGGRWCWIAESDDVAHPRLLETLARQASGNPAIVLSYARSATVDDETRTAAQVHDDYLQRVAPHRDWNKPHVGSGDDEIRGTLYLANTVPNVSAALLDRARALAGLAEIAPRYATLGDWALYLAMLKGGAIAYSPERCNLHRRLDEGVILSRQASPIFHIERATIHIAVARSVPLEAAQVEAMIALQNAEFDWLSRDVERPDRSYLQPFQDQLRALSAGRGESGRPHVLLVSSVSGDSDPAAVADLARDLARRRRVWHLPLERSVDAGPAQEVAILPPLPEAELERFLALAEIDAVGTHGPAAERLGLRLKQARPDIVWIVGRHGAAGAEEGGEAAAVPAVADAVVLMPGAEEADLPGPGGGRIHDARRGGGEAAYEEILARCGRRHSPIVAGAADGL